jgi:hypothetical protein
MSHPFDRREFLRLGLQGAAAFALARALPANAFGAPAAPSPKLFAPPGEPMKPGNAKAVIQIWLWGGPPHLDTFDPKPDAGRDYCGPYNKALPTNVDGMLINPLLPMLAKQADKYALLRGMTHGNNGHETAAYMMQTGRKPGGDLVYPGIGAVVTHLLHSTRVTAQAVGCRKLHYVAHVVLFVRVAQFVEQLAGHPLLHVRIALAKSLARRQLKAGARAFWQAQQALFHSGRQLARAQRQRGGLVIEGVDHVTRRPGQAVVQSEERAGLNGGKWGSGSGHVSPDKLPRL